MLLKFKFIIITEIKNISIHIYSVIHTTILESNFLETHQRDERVCFLSMHISLISGFMVESSCSQSVSIFSFDRRILCFT